MSEKTRRGAGTAALLLLLVATLQLSPSCSRKDHGANPLDSQADSIFRADSALALLASANLWVLGECGGLVVEGRYAYIAGYSETVCIIDIANPLSPRMAGITLPEVGADPAYWVSRPVAKWGNWFFVEDNMGTGIFDVSAPSSIKQIGEIHTARNQEPRGMGVSAWLGRTLCYSGQNVYDVRSPANPLCLDTLRFSDGSCPPDEFETYVLGKGFCGKYLIAVAFCDSDPKNPELWVLLASEARLVNSIPLPYDGGANLAICSTTVLVGGGWSYCRDDGSESNSWTQIDVSEVSDPRIVRTVDLDTVFAEGRYRGFRPQIACLTGDRIVFGGRRGLIVCDRDFNCLRSDISEDSNLEVRDCVVSAGLLYVTTDLGLRIYRMP